MPIRYYICPVVGTGTGQDPQRPKVADYHKVSAPIHYSAAIATGPTGLTVKPWCIARVEGVDLTAIEADPQCVDIFEKLTNAVGTRAEVISWLKTHAVADVPAAMRTRISTRLSALGIDTTGITLTTTLWDVVVIVFREHEPFNSLEDL